MTKYKPFLIQKLKDLAIVRDSEEFGVRVKHVPFKIFPEMKEVHSVSFHDENGDDEFIPETPTFKAYEMDCEFLYQGLHGTANVKIKEFLTYLSTGGAFSIYDTYTGIGRTEVRYAGYEEDVLYRKDDEDDAVIFSVKLKVNDPVTDIILSKL